MRLSRRRFTAGMLTALLPLAPGAKPAWAKSAEEATIVADGRPAAIVLPDMPQECVRYAADELAWHLEQATGARPAILAEKAAAASGRGGSLIYLGETRFSKTAGIRTGSLPESSVIRTVGKHLCISGVDEPGNPLSMDTSAGTLFGVYEILERHLGVRWLWPGELGTVVPKVRSLAIPPMDLAVSPAFMQRRVRPDMDVASADHPELGFSPDAAERYFKDQAVFLRRHRLGRRQRASYGHAFVNWWTKYGSRHPEWFQLVNGKRGPVRWGARFSMCISNPALREEIVARWQRKTKKGPQRNAPFVNAVENDIPGQCECAQCRALDGPEPDDYRRFIPPTSKIASKPFVSDRYARSWLAIQQIAARHDPDATVVGYAYLNYFAAPTSGVRLNKNILVGFCPPGSFYPRAAEEHGWIKRQWRGWAETGAQLLIRANYFLDGYCMPHIFAHQFADEFQSAARQGMVGTDFDSLTGQWAAQGPNLYLLMRLQSRPDASPDELLSEYYAGFGPAADQVKAYFDHWEAFAAAHRAELKDAFERLGASRWRSWAKAAHAAFPEESFAGGEALLQTALASAGEDREAAERVEFLQLGLEHARLCARVARQLTLADPDSSYERGRADLEALLAFRRAHERSWISNLNHCAWIEGQSWNLPKEPVAAVSSKSSGATPRSQRLPAASGRRGERMREAILFQAR